MRRGSIYFRGNKCGVKCDSSQKANEVCHFREILHCVQNDSKGGTPRHNPYGTLTTNHCRVVVGVTATTTNI